MTAKPDPSLPWPIDYESGVLPIAGHENCLLSAYKCPAGKWTCGWGETSGVTATTKWTKAYADQRFCDSLTERANLVLEACTQEPTPNQLSALVSFAYNYGAWKTSTALKAHNRGDALAAANGIQLVDKFRNPKTGKLEVSGGLRSRRASEAALYLRPNEGSAHEMPQEVASEQRMAKSPTVQTASIGATAGALTLVSQAGETLGPVSAGVSTAKSFWFETLGFGTEFFLPGLVVVICGLVLWRRYGQRLQGVA